MMKDQALQDISDREEFERTLWAAIKEIEDAQNILDSSDELNSIHRERAPYWRASLMRAIVELKKVQW